jgi:Bacterial PH domain
MTGWPDPNVDRYITLRAGEQKVLEVPKHWAAYLGPQLRLVVGVVVCAWAVRLPGLWMWLVLWWGWVLVCEAAWRHLQLFRDRFVLTTVRIFRFSGVISTNRATIPLGRITDMTVQQPTLGQWWGYGHLRFESAGQVQDLERVKFVRDVDRVDDVLRIVASRRRLEQAYEDWTAGEIQGVLEGR